MQSELSNATWRSYLTLARVDRCSEARLDHTWHSSGSGPERTYRSARLRILLGRLSVVMIASSNIIINEWLDREFDAHHPTKSKRASVRHDLDPRLISIEYAVLAGLGPRAWLSDTLLCDHAAVPAFGLLYNVEPFRLKDRTYVDVISDVSTIQYAWSSAGR